MGRETYGNLNWRAPSLLRSVGKATTTADPVAVNAWARRGSTWSVPLALFLLVLVAVGPFIYPLRPQQASRYALTRAVAESGTVVLDEYEHLLDRDRAVKDGHVYSDKAPGQPLYAVPFMLVGRLAGFEPANQPYQRESLDLWWVTLWSATLFGAGLLVLMYLRVREIVPSHALAASMGVFFGTMLLPFSAILFGHVMAALLLYGAYVLLLRASGPVRVAAAGALAGASVLVEYTTAIAVVPLTVLVIWRLQRQIGWWIAGGLSMAVPLALYNTLAFGSAWTFSYQFTAWADVTDGPRSLLHMFSPASLDNLTALFFSGRGLLIATPIVICAVIAAFVRLRDSLDADALLGVIMFGSFLLIPILWENPWGGASPGPRYMTPALPFLALPLAWSWRRWPSITRAAVAISVMTMTAALVAQAMPFDGHPAGLGVWLKLLTLGLTTDTLWTRSLGSWGWAAHAASVLVGLLAVYLAVKRESRVPNTEAPDMSVV